LSQSPVFSGLLPEMRRKIAASADIRTFRRAEVLARELERSEHFLLLLEGGVEVCRYAHDGRRTVFRTLYPPAGIGYLLLSGEPHTAELVAAGNAMVALIPVAVMKELFAARPEILYKAIARLAELVDALSSELMEERTLPLLERVRRSIYRNADHRGTLSISHEELAQYVGASRANVSRMLKRLETDGVISLGRRAIRINRDSPQG
jgi:CRP-like cAMP-binding protein